MYVYDLLFVRKFMPFFSFIFPFEMSHKQRRESTKTGEDHGFSFAETTGKNSAFLRYTYILRVFIIAKARIYSSLPT
jgi:hypothetical protein